MNTEQQKFWIVEEMADSRYPITVKINIFKRFAVKFKKNRTREGLRRIVNKAERRISEETA